MQSDKGNLPRTNIEKILENATPGMRNAIPKEETYNKYGGDARRVGIEAIGELGPFSGTVLGNSGGCP